MGNEDESSEGRGERYFAPIAAPSNLLIKHDGQIHSFLQHPSTFLTDLFFSYEYFGEKKNGDGQNAPAAYWSMLLGREREKWGESYTLLGE